jgi:hypothetical protein
MALTDEEKAQLEALTAKANEPDDNEDFDIEIWDEHGAGAKVPYSKGRSWLARFGIDVDPPTDDGGKPAGNGKPDGKASKDDTKPGTAGRYFGSSKK